MPGLESGGNENFWYSFDYGMAHFVMLNSETDLGNGLVGPSAVNGSMKENSGDSILCETILILTKPGPFGKYQNQQVDFLKADLAKVDRTATPWVIVMMHRPWYTSTEYTPEDVCLVCQEAFEDIFYEQNVDLVISGHVHSYQVRISRYLKRI